MVDNRITQIPILTVDLTNQPARVTQLPVLTVSLPVQPARVTQLPALVPNHPRPVPAPAMLIPTAPVQETYTFRSVVTQAKSSKEQRTRLRETPRYVFSHRVHIESEEQGRAAQAFAYKYVDKEIVHPLYHMWSKLVQPSSMYDDRLYFDPSHTDLREGEQLALFDVYSMHTSMHTIAALYSDGAQLTAPLGRDVSVACAVCPALPCRLQHPPRTTFDDDNGTLSVTIESFAQRRFQRIEGFVLPSLGGIPVLDRKPYGTMDKEYNRNVEWVDSELSLPTPRTAWRQGLLRGTRDYVLDRETDMDFWRALMDHMGGKHKTFRLPTYENDLPLAEVPSLGASVLVTSNIQAFEYLMANSNRAVSIWRQNGLIHRELLDVKMLYTEHGDPVAVQLYLDGTIGSDAGANIIHRVSLLCRVRSGDDGIPFEHHRHHSTVRLNVVGVNE